MVIIVEVHPIVGMGIGSYNGFVVIFATYIVDGGGYFV